MEHVVMNSGGIGSWAAGKRVAEKYGTDNLIHLFTDTKKKNDQHPHRGEDQDLYRFLVEGVEIIGGTLEWISKGSHIWQVFEDNRYMANSRIDPCSRELKREMARKWVEKRYKPDEVTIYIGIDWTEYHRTVAIKRYWEPYNVEFPMCEQPFMSKNDMCKWAESLGVERPRLYKMGFAHNNCGGFCVKAGLAQFYQLLKTMPERYAYHEFKQEELFQVLGKNRPFLKQTVNKVTTYLSLREFREKVEDIERKQQDIGEQIDMFDFGGCGCFSDIDKCELVEG
jgi:hypothetical protein